jgi:hypothetical protein
MWAGYSTVGLHTPMPSTGFKHNTSNAALLCLGAQDVQALIVLNPDDWKGISVKWLSPLGLQMKFGSSGPGGQLGIEWLNWLMLGISVLLVGFNRLQLQHLILVQTSTSNFQCGGCWVSLQCAVLFCFCELVSLPVG